MRTGMDQIKKLRYMNNIVKMTQFIAQKKPRSREVKRVESQRANSLQKESGIFLLSFLTQNALSIILAVFLSIKVKFSVT